MKESKPGDIVTIDGKQYKVVLGGDEVCINCVAEYDDKLCNKFHNYIGMCSRNIRSDHYEIVYKEVK